MTFPTTRIENLELSRLIVGTNWFLGFSHYSAAKDRWLKGHMTLERIVEVMCVFARNGINAVMSIQGPTMKEAIRRVREETGVEMHWICTPSGESVEDLMPGIEESAEMGAKICMPHQHWTDGNMIVNQKRIIGLGKVTERIRELGMIPGLSTHRPETVVVADSAGYDVATYTQMYNAIGFLCQVETDWIARVINKTEKPVMCIKPLAGGKVISHKPAASECATPSFSPDGKRLFFVDENYGGEDRLGSGRIAYLDSKTWQLTGGKWGTFGDRRLRCPAVSPDGKQLAYSTADHFWEMHWSYLSDTITGKRPRFLGTDLGLNERRMSPHHSGRHSRRMYNECPVWAPNSRYFLFVRGPDLHEARFFQFNRQMKLVDWMDLYLADPANKRCVRLTWLKSRMGYPDWWAPKKK